MKTHETKFKEYLKKFCINCFEPGNEIRNDIDNSDVFTDNCADSPKQRMADTLRHLSTTPKNMVALLMFADAVYDLTKNLSDEDFKKELETLDKVSKKSTEDTDKARQMGLL